MDLNDIPDGMEGHEVAARTYAIFAVDVSPSEAIGAQLRRAYRHIWQSWLPASGYDFAEAPDFERYDERFDPGTKSGLVEIYIPVRRG